MRDCLFGFCFLWYLNWGVQLDQVFFFWVIFVEFVLLVALDTYLKVIFFFGSWGVIKRAAHWEHSGMHRIHENKYNT